MPAEKAPKESKPKNNNAQESEVLVAEEAGEGKETASFQDNREQNKAILEVRSVMEDGKKGKGSFFNRLVPQKEPKKLKKRKAYFYTWDEKQANLVPLEKEVLEGGTVFFAAKVTSNKDFARIGIKNEEEHFKFGYVRIADFSNTNLWPWSFGETGLLKPINNEELENSKTYHKANHDWYLNFAILYDTYKSLDKIVEGKDEVKAQKAKETQHRIALTVLQNYAKAAGEGLAKSSPGIQITAFNEGKYYHRNSGGGLTSKINELLKDKIKIDNPIRVISDPFVREAIARNFPVLYTEESENLEEVNTTIDSIDSFKASMKNLCNNHANNFVLKDDFVFNFTKYYENIKNNNNSEQEAIVEIQERIVEAIKKSIEENSDKDVEYKKELIDKVVKKIKLVIVTEFEGIHYMVGLKHMFKEKDFFRKKNSPITSMLNHSGMTIDPLSAKEVLLKLNSLENILHDTTEAKIKAKAEAKAKAKAKAKEEKSRKLKVRFKKIFTGVNLSDIEERLKLIRDRLKKRFRGVSLSEIVESPTNYESPEQRIPLLTLATKEDNKSPKSTTGNTGTEENKVALLTFDNFIKHTVLKKFKALEEEKDTLPYVQIYVPATIDLLNGLKEKINIDKEFAERGISNLLKASCFRMLLAMTDAIRFSDNMVRFLNHIEVIHNQIQMILAITEPYEQNEDFTEAIQGILTDFYMPEVDEEEEKVVVEKEKKIEETQPEKTQPEKKPKRRLPKFLRQLDPKLISSFFKPKKEKPKDIPHKNNPIVAESLPKEKPAKKPENNLGNLLKQAEIQHKASAMHATSSALAAAEKEKGTNRLNVLVLEGNYYEAIGYTDDEGNKTNIGLVKEAKTHKVSVLRGKELEKGTSLDEAIDGEVKEKFDVFLCDFHHNVSTYLDEYKVENLIAHVQTLFKDKKVAPKFTVAIDSTIDFIRSNDIKEFLAAFEGEITSGKLNVVIYRSAQKFDMLGLDNYYGGYSITINNRESYKKFNERISDPQDNIQGLAHQGLTHLNTHASHHLDDYRRAIIKNNKLFYDKLIAAGLGKEYNENLYVVKSSDPDMVFINFRGAKSIDVCSSFASFFESVKERFSFGFATTNYAPINSRARITVGLDSEELIDQYVDYFEIRHKNINSEQLINEKFNERKEARAKKASISRLSLGKAFSIKDLSDYRIDQILTMLRGEMKYKVRNIEEKDKRIIEKAITHGDKEVLEAYKIERCKKGFVIRKISDKHLIDNHAPKTSKEPANNPNDEKVLEIHRYPEDFDIIGEFYVSEETDTKESYGSETNFKSQPTSVLKPEEFKNHKRKKRNAYQQNGETTKYAKGNKNSMSSKKDNNPKVESIIKKLIKVSNHGDGDCLFFSLNNNSNKDQANALRKDIVSHQKKENSISELYAQMLVQQLLGDKEYLKLDEKTAWIALYYDLMSQPKRWGSREEISAFSSLKNKTVILIAAPPEEGITIYEGGVSKKITSIPEDAFSSENIIVLYKTELHFERVEGIKKDKGSDTYESLTTEPIPQSSKDLSNVKTPQICDYDIKYVQEELRKELGKKNSNVSVGGDLDVNKILQSLKLKNFEENYKIQWTDNDTDGKPQYHIERK